MNIDEYCSMQYTHVCICLHHFASCFILLPAACSGCPDWGLPCPRPLPRATAAVHSSPFHGFWDVSRIKWIQMDQTSKTRITVESPSTIYNSFSPKMVWTWTGRCWSVMFALHNERPTCRGYLDFFHNPWRQPLSALKRCTSQYLPSFANRSFQSSGILSVWCYGLKVQKHDIDIDS